MAAGVTDRAAWWHATTEHLSRSPGTVIVIVRCLMIATLLTLLCGSLYLQLAFDGLRATNNRTVLKAFNTRELVVALHAALAEERGARLARTPAALSDASGRFESAADQAHKALRAMRLTTSPSSYGIATSTEALTGAVEPALRSLRAMIPAYPGAAVPAGSDDHTILAPSMAAAMDLERRTMHARRVYVSRLQRRERYDIAGSLAGLTLFVVVLGGGAIRLIEGRERLLAARRAATHQAQLLSAAVDHMPDGVAVFDADHRLILRNARFGPVGRLPDTCTVFGAPFSLTAQALAGAEPDLLAMPEPKLGSPVAGEMRMAGRVLAAWRSAMPAGGQMLTLSDVTERVAAEEVARRAQRMEALGRLTGGVAHDFNNLLQALSANLDVLVSEAQGVSPRLSALASEAIGAVERGQRLTRHLLAFARRQELDAVPLDAVDILTSLRDLLNRTLGDTIEIHLSTEPDLWPVLGDPAGLENALLNLALNARDAMPKGGRLTVTARNLPDPAGDRVCISVIDEGVGMTEEQIARAVEPFFTTKSLGSGLGLAVVDGFARQSGGSFRLRSALGRGTDATLALPRAPAILAPATPHASPRIEHGRGETILLVEDDTAVAAAAREVLTTLGYAVVEAHDVGAACALLESGLRPHLIFTDVMMPGPRDVADLTRFARAIRPDLPILLNTGDMDAPALSSVSFDRHMALLGKPWRLSDLSRTLRRMLDGVVDDVALRTGT